MGRTRRGASSNDPGLIRRILCGLCLVMLLAVPTAGALAQTEVAPTEVTVDDRGDGPVVLAPTEEPTVAPEPTEAQAGGTLSFQVGICPPGVVTFPDVMQVDGLPDCAGTGLAGGETPLSGGTVSVTNLDTGETVDVGLDSGGFGSIAVASGNSYAASVSIGGVGLDARSVCGSSFGIGGSIADGVGVASGEDVSCSVLTLSLEPAPAPVATGGEIRLLLEACSGLVQDAALLLTGNGCGGETGTAGTAPFPGVDVTFTNSDTGEVTSATTDDAGFASSGAISAGSYVGTLSVQGKNLTWASSCQAFTTGGSGTPLGVVGALEDAGAPPVLVDGQTIVCRAISLLPATNLDGDPPKKPVTLKLRIRHCADDFDWGPVVGAGKPTAASITAVDNYYRATCVDIKPLPVEFHMNPGGAYPAPDSVITNIVLEDTYTTTVIPGGSIVFRASDATPDLFGFWAQCSVDGVYDRLGFALKLTVPKDFTGDTIMCSVFVNQAAGTLTNVIHTCNGPAIDTENLTCAPGNPPLGQMTLNSGMIWMDLSGRDTHWADTDYVYAGRRWYTRDGFGGRTWTTLSSTEGVQVLQTVTPLTTVNIGAGNLGYKATAILVYCGSDEAEWSEYRVIPIDSGKWGTVSLPIGIDGAPRDMTCHWFIDARKL